MNKTTGTARKRRSTMSDVNRRKAAVRDAVINLVHEIEDYRGGGPDAELAGCDEALVAVAYAVDWVVHTRNNLLDVCKKEKK